MAPAAAPMPMPALAPVESPSSLTLLALLPALVLEGPGVASVVVGELAVEEVVLGLVLVLALVEELEEVVEDDVVVVPVLVTGCAMMGSYREETEFHTAMVCETTGRSGNLLMLDRSQHFGSSPSQQ